MTPTTEITKIAREFGPDRTTLLLAMDVRARHIDGLPANDRLDLLASIDAFFGAENEEDKAEAFATIVEIFSQEEMTATRVDPDEIATSEGALKWASHIGAKIRELRTAKGWTQEQLAQASGLPQSHISRLELGQHSPSHVTVEKLAAALGIDSGKLDPSR